MAERAGYYDIFRKRVAPIAFLIGLVVLGTRTCSTEMAEVELTFDFGSAAADVRSLRVDVFREGESIGAITFERHYGDDGAKSDPRVEATLDAGTYHVAFSVVMKDGRRRFDRTMTINDRAAVTLSLERDLINRAD